MTVPFALLLQTLNMTEGKEGLELFYEGLVPETLFGSMEDYSYNCPTSLSETKVGCRLKIGFDHTITGWQRRGACKELY